ncbi:MAG: hypothetical protein ACKVI4_16815 [Actinomycetales bacterium]
MDAKASMAGTGAQTYTLQLNSATAEKTSSTNEEYRLQLTPPISCPFMAAPRTMLESLAFTNCFSNIDKERYGNQSLTLKWNPYYEQASPYTPQRTEKTVTVEIPDGHYTIDTLEQVVAEVLYKETHNGTPAITQASTLWDDMNVLAGLKPSPADLPFTLAGSGAQHGDSLAVTVLPPQHLVGSAIAHANIPAGTKIGKITGPAASPVTGELGRIFLSQSIPGAGKFTGHVTVTPIGVADSDFRGFGAAQIAYPSLNEASGWGTALSFEEMQMVAMTAGAAANTVAQDFAHTSQNSSTTAQSQRALRPIQLMPNKVTNKLQIIVAVPHVQVDASSTLFSGTLGVTQWTSTEQNMFKTAAVKDRVPWTAVEPAKLLRNRSIEFHCPSLVNSSYDQHGRMQGAQLASIPIQVPANDVQVWSASYDNSVPCAVHGGTVDSLAFYLTNQDNERLSFQKTSFQATIRLYWADPVPPPVGSAGAEAEEAFGLRDVKYI